MFGVTLFYGNEFISHRESASDELHCRQILEKISMPGITSGSRTLDAVEKCYTRQCREGLVSNQLQMKLRPAAREGLSVDNDRKNQF